MTLPKLMTRPMPFKFAAVWVLWMLLCGGSILRPNGALGAGWGALIFAFLIWEGVGLFAMRRLNIWIAVGLLMLWIAAILLILIKFLVGSRGLPIQGILILPILAVLNGVCVYYFVRPEFLDFAARFVAEHEKHSQLMGKVSQKRVTEELRRMNAFSNEVLKRAD